MAAEQDKIQINPLMKMMAAIGRVPLEEVWKYELMYKQTAIDMAYASGILWDASKERYDRALQVESRIAGIDPIMFSSNDDPVPSSKRVNLARTILSHGPTHDLDEQQSSKPKYEVRLAKKISRKPEFDFSQDVHYLFADSLYSRLMKGEKGPDILEASAEDVKFLKKETINKARYVNQVLGMVYVQSQWHNDFSTLFDSHFGKVQSASQEDIDAFFKMPQFKIRSTVGIRAGLETHADNLAIVTFVKPQLEVPYQVIPKEGSTPSSLIDAIVTYEGRGMYNDVFDMSLLGWKPFGLPTNRKKWREMTHAGMVAIAGDRPKPTNTFYDLSNGEMVMHPAADNSAYSTKAYPVSDGNIMWAIDLQNSFPAVGTPVAVEKEVPGSDYVFLLSGRSLEVWATRNELRRQDITDAWSKKLKQELVKVKDPAKRERLAASYKQKCEAEKSGIEVLTYLPSVHKSSSDYIYVPPRSVLEFPVREEGKTAMKRLETGKHESLFCKILYQPTLPLYSTFI